MLPPVKPSDLSVLPSQIISRAIDRRNFAALALLLVACSRSKAPDKLGTVPAFSLRDQDGKVVSDQTLKGGIWAAAFMFTRCPTICPRITTRMRELQTAARAKNLPLRLVSISVDPEHDQPAVLKTYAAKYGADLATWSFLTGDDAVIRKTATEGFKLALEGKADASADHMGLLHGSHLILVDRELQIRGYFGTLDASDNERLLTAAGAL
jgi:protein SCO1/2